MRKILTMLVIAGALATVPGAGRQTARLEVDLQAAIRMETVEGDLKGAVEAYKKLAEAGDRAIAAKALIRLGGCYEKLGDAALREARTAYERVVREYGDQTAAAAEARAKLAAIAGAGGAPGATTLTVRRILALDISGQVSPDGRFLSFTDWESGGNLAIYDLATGRSRLLTDDGSLRGSGIGYAEASVPSPDGRSVAYGWFGATYDLRVVGIDGSKPRVLRAGGDGVVRQSPLAWSPDSKHVLVAVMKSDRTRDMMLVAVADGSAKLLKAMGKNPSEGGIFSPDGRYIAWSTSEGFSLFELQTGKETPLIRDRSNHGVLGWAPDGKHILFSSERWGSADAWLVAVADGKAQGEPVFVKKDWGFRPMGFTRSGAFYYAVNNTVGDVKVAELDPASGKLVSPPKSISQRGNTWAPAWSPDGRFLAYIFVDEPHRTVIVRSLDTGEEREYEVGERTIGLGAGLRWIPDGTAVAVPVFEPGKGETLVRLDVKTGRVTSLMALPAGVGFPRYGFSPDGGTVFYVRPAVLPSENWSVMAHDLRSGQETKVVERPGLNHGVVSPDGRRLAITMGEGSHWVLLVMPVTGGEPRELVRIDREKEYVWGASPWWSPDGRYISFLKGVKEKVPDELQVWRVPAEGGELQRTELTVGRQIAGLKPHPDGRRLASADFKVNLEVWIMENFLPKEKGAR